MGESDLVFLQYMAFLLGSRGIVLSRFFSTATYSSYIQGNSPQKGIREYFYFIDHNGMLFLDDARIKNFTSCYKEKKFLHFFFSRIVQNETNAYPEFPYLSPCGRERNYIRCDDLPIVFTHLVTKDGAPHLTYGLAGDSLSVPFQPAELIMFPDTGRVYHPGVERVDGVGLVCSKLAIEFSKHFVFENGEDAPPTHLIWNGIKVEIEYSILPLLEGVKKRIKGK